MKKYVVIFMTLAMLFSMVACGAHASSNDPVDISVYSQKNTDVDTTNKGDLFSATPVSNDEKTDKEDSSTNISSDASDSDKTVENSDNTSSDNSSANNSSSDNDTTGSESSTDSGADDPIDTPVNNNPPVVDPDDEEDPAPVHTHSWTDNGVAVVCPGCGMLDHGHVWDPIYTTEVVDDYEMQPRNYCSTCEEDVTDLLASGSSMKKHRQDTGCIGSGYYGDYVQVHIGSHEEQVVVGHKCSICGAEK